MTVAREASSSPILACMAAKSQEDITTPPSSRRSREVCLFQLQPPANPWYVWAASQDGLEAMCNLPH